MFAEMHSETLLNM